jgi:hypothetical protein
MTSNLCVYRGKLLDILTRKAPLGPNFMRVADKKALFFDINPTAVFS